MELSEELKKQIIDTISKNRQLPNSFQNLLFPVEHKEYILNYVDKMRKEDVLANTDGVEPCPLQIDKIFNGKEHPSFDDGWRNLLIFGDNLQLLKTIYENKDPLVKDKIKHKIKLIYIDPPFATEDEFKSSTGAKAYNDKKRGSEFLEFIRRRLILAKEILADDGNIFVHIDQKMGHYVKVIMDEVFGKNNYRNEIIWSYKSGGASKTNFANKHDIIFWYSKTSNYIFNEQKYKRYVDKSKGYDPRIEYHKDEDGREYRINIMTDVWEDIGIISPNGFERVGYPTQKPEPLLKRIIESCSNEGDLIFDFFCGSGTTIATAEKLNRKWIGCDIGKLSYYTTQKRILKIQESKEILSEKLYSKKAKNFVTAQLGLYDLAKTLELDLDNYKHFVSHLFGFDLFKKNVGGITFDGLKQESLVHIFDFKKFKDSFIDEEYLYNLHESIGNKTNGTVYVVSPISFCPSTDYHEIGDVRYYFLKVPYHVIKEFHKKPFQRSNQPKNKENVNDLDYAIGFHFINPPEVKSVIKIVENNLVININKFKSNDSHKEDFNNFSELSSIFIDKNYNESNFILSESFFHDDLIKKDCEEINIFLNLKEVGNFLKIIYTDIYGNEFIEVINVNKLRGLK